jgi:sulfite reductase (NADPH) flavoprotein alpha-component
MLRRLHSFSGLIAGLLVALIALTGAILSVDPALERAGVSDPAAGSMTVADFAAVVQTRFPEAERVVRKASGQMVVYSFDGDLPRADIVDPVTAEPVADYVPSDFTRWVTDLHRSFLLGEMGRAVSGVGAAIMVLMTVSGAMMVAARMGGWRAFLGRVRGTRRQRWHVQLARFAVAGLLLSAATGAYMSLTSFGFVPDGMDAEPEFPLTVDGGTPMSVTDIAALQTVDLTELRELSFPYATDPTDVYTLTTATGMGYIDQATGETLSWLDNGTARQIYEFVFMLHTGQGLWWLALILGAGVATVPVLAVTGTLVWWARRRGTPRIAGNGGAQVADTVILVGSEGNSTWGFARTLHQELTARGHVVHVAAMNQLAASYKRAKRVFVMTATYGDGTAPASAKHFMARMEAMVMEPVPVSVVGFGDRQFPKFCKFAEDVAEAFGAKGWPLLVPFGTIDRQSAQEFARWGEGISAALGEPVVLTHVPVLPQTVTLRLAEREDYGAELQSPAAVLRFVAADGVVPASGLRGVWQRMRGQGLPAFAPGDLVGILPEGSTVPRFYSLASGRKDGMLEICVRKQPGGLCSGALMAMQSGETIECFVQPNPTFRPAHGHGPVILIGAGTGIGPLAGFIRHNDGRRQMHLYFGARDPQSDFLYQPQLLGLLADNRLTRLTTAFSRVASRAYVQDRLREDQVHLRDLIAKGAQIIVCGGRDMGHGVALALDDVLAPMGLSAGKLRAGGRYVEDVY